MFQSRSVLPLDGYRIDTLARSGHPTCGVAMTRIEHDEAAPVRRWVEGVVTTKVVDRQTVTLRSAEHQGTEFGVSNTQLWKDIEVGAMGIAETDEGELVGWRSLSPPA